MIDAHKGIYSGQLRHAQMDQLKLIRDLTDRSPGCGVVSRCGNRRAKEGSRMQQQLRNPGTKESTVESCQSNNRIGIELYEERQNCYGEANGPRQPRAADRSHKIVPTARLPSKTLPIPKRDQLRNQVDSETLL
ncbi:unnamed protein product [Haemonchus placei]|uniref:Uncharacterized protein n=1 Tax=Haemonchus placei TaxID=6290 RepID=A0A0N4WUD0_HAEPC|nr:unnamed protein product [Haemonchus placei]